MAGEEGHLDCLHPGAYEGNFSVGRIHLVLQALQGEAQAADDRQIEVHGRNLWLLAKNSYRGPLHHSSGIRGGRKTPFSVMMPLISSSGVASKAGL